MATKIDLTAFKESLSSICTVPERIISVYSLEKHIWANGNDDLAIRNRIPEIKTIEEFQIDPVRHFLNDIFRNIAAPYKPEKKDEPIGQGYWIQAEFGSGKSHLLCFLASMALGSEDAWELVREKEKRAGRGKRESLARFWDEGIKAKSTDKGKGIFVVAKTLVGSGGGTVGRNDSGRRLSEYIIDAVKEQLYKELGKNISLYPVEILTDRFLTQDLERYRSDLKKFLKSPEYWEEDEFEDIDKFIRDIQENKSPEYKKSCGNKLWRFYDEYLRVRPQIETDTEDVLRHVVKAIISEGYSGVLLLLDEVSLFMKDRDDSQRIDDEKTLVVLSNRLAKVENLPIWTVCAAQQAIESTTPGSKNIIADDRLKLVPLLQEDNDYYTIVLSRVREIVKPDAILGYYNFYKKGFNWPNDIGQNEFHRFFPFHKPAIEILRDITYELTTTRSAIHFMYQTLKHSIKNEKTEIITLCDFFDEAIEYEEDPSGTNAGLVAIKTKRDRDYRVYEICKQNIDSAQKGMLKVYREKALKILQILFLYYVAKREQNGLTAENLANNILIEKKSDAPIQENIEHYDVIADNIRKNLQQIVESRDEDNKSRFRFDPNVSGIDPREEFIKARNEAEQNEKMLDESWYHLLSLNEWIIKTYKTTYDLSHGIKSIFYNIAPSINPWQNGYIVGKADQLITVLWQNRKIEGLIGIRELSRLAFENKALPAIESSETDRDFAVFVSIYPVDFSIVEKLLAQRKDPRIILWTPGEFTEDERNRLIDFAAYRKLIYSWQGKESDDAIIVVDWVNSQLRSEMGSIEKIVSDRYSRGRMDALNNTEMDFHVAGELTSILTPIVDRVLSSTYESKNIRFEGNISFSKEDATKVINGIVKKGNIPKGTKLGKDENAVQNFGEGLQIIKSSNWRELDISNNQYIKAFWQFIDTKLENGTQTMPVTVIYKNFTGIAGPENKNYGLNRWIIQIYLLSMVREGKIRINLSDRLSLPSPYIDYSTITSFEFSKKILDGIVDIQKLEKPENWDILRPYAEKIIRKEIESTSNDLEISEYRREIREFFEKEKTNSNMLVKQAKNLFDIIEVSNPYEEEILQLQTLFSHDLSATNDIDSCLYALKDAFGYKAFDEGKTDYTEVEDFTIKMGIYDKIKKFLNYEPKILSVFNYCNYPFPELQELNKVREIIIELHNSIHNIKKLIDSEVKVQTDLIGTGISSEEKTLTAVILEYEDRYVALHINVFGLLEEYRNKLNSIMSSEEMRVLMALEKVSALENKKGSDKIKTVIEKNVNKMLSCSDPSHNSISRDLMSFPEHKCGLSFNNYQEELESAFTLVYEAEEIFDSELKNYLEFFLNPKIKELLNQGRGDEVIDGILRCNDTDELEGFFKELSLKNMPFVEIINRYLKKIVVKRISISDFQPSTKTIEKDYLDTLVKEFREYLEREMKSIEISEDELPMLQLEW